MEDHAIPVIPRGVRLHHDRVRSRWVLLAPERTVALDDIGHAILSQVDGARSFGALVDLLAERYGAPRDQVAGDVGAFLSQLAERRFVEVAP